ncbi:MAG: ATP-binding cassette domain-containing protein [Chloroflexi bacterium]|nr:MAG: ATP-binding cassette domain-containing protein [Chloroflexota bacterium]
MIAAVGGSAGLQVPAPILFLGLVTGATYGLLAVGLVLVYRSNRIINFAHGETGAFAAALLGVAVVSWHFLYWLVLPLALMLGAGTGALTEVAVVRRLRHVPRLMSMVATLGAAALLLGFEAVASAQARTGSLYPQPPGFPSFHLGSLLITPAYTAMLVLSPIAVAAITVFLRYTRYGLAIRAAAANPDAARLASVSVARMSTLTWAIAGGLSALTAILIFPTQSFLSAEAFGPELMLRALAAAVIARMNSLPLALGAGVLVGEVEAVLYWNYPSGGAVEAILFGLIVVALLLQPGVGGRRADQGGWAALQGWRPIPDAWRRVWTVRHLGLLTGLLALALAMLLPLLISFGASFKLATIFAIAVVGVSVFLVTGLAGQLSLGQFALAGIGAWCAYLTAQASGNYLLAVFAGGAAGGIASIAVGIPALRIRGLMLAVTTLAFALMTSSWLLQQHWSLGAGVIPGRPVIGSLVFTSSKAYYYFALAFLVLGTWIAANVRRGGLGRLFVAIRDNEDAARAFTVNVVGRKLQAFALAGFLAGIGGAVYGFALARISSDAFLPALSINVVAMTVIGGIGILGGPILGALYIFALPAFVPLDAVSTVASAAGWLLLILYFPGGIAGLLAPQRDRLVRALVRLAGADPDALLATPDGPPGGITQLRPALSRATAEVRPLRAGKLLEVEEVSKSYGGIQAVNRVSLEVNEGEILGLIGPNGAGKTTLFELIAGFTHPDGGRIRFDGQRLTRTLVFGSMRRQLSVPAFMRARQGLVRSFQDPRLFPTMTVLETVMLAQEGRLPTTLFAAVVGSQELERPKRQQARELIMAMGLERYTHTQIQELSTGTRRIAELCALVATQPRLLLLDEPSSGIAQAECEALGGLLQRIKEHLVATLILIEHDIPLVMGISDRVAAMESGRIICTGRPAEVRADPRVIEAYLGADVSAIERSGERSLIESSAQ